MQKKALVIIDIQNDITKNYKDVTIYAKQIMALLFYQIALQAMIKRKFPKCCDITKVMVAK